MFAVSDAKSASMMRLRAADWFSTELCRFEMIESKRLSEAPKVARTSLTSSMALSMLSITVPMALASAVWSMTAEEPVTAVILLSLVMSVVVIETVSLLVVLAPTWKSILVASEPSIALPLKVVPPSTRVISCCSCENSLFSESLSDVLLVELRACTASSLMRCSESPTCASAPSAVWDSEMPSLELRIATFMPRTCEFMRSAMARPAASSLAELMRRPEDRRCIEVDSEDCDAARLRCASSEAMLVLIERVMMFPMQEDEELRRASPGRAPANSFTRRQVLLRAGRRPAHRLTLGHSPDPSSIS